MVVEGSTLTTKNMTKNFSTSTEKGRNGINISYSDELDCAKSILKKLPKGWKVHFDWMQLIFEDVKYRIDWDEKKLYVAYNQNLTQWWDHLERDVTSHLKAKGEI